MIARDGWDDVGGGGGVAAVALTRLAGAATLYTALGSDPVGAHARERLEAYGVRVHAGFRDAPQPRAFTHLDAGGERTITVLGEPTGPSGDDPLDWAALAGAEGVYFTGGDAGAARAARAAKVLVATPRGARALAEGGVQVDVLVHSAHDEHECAAADALRPVPLHRVATSGARGGSWSAADGRAGAWRAAQPPGPVVDAFGCGDAFAAGLTFGLARGDDLDAAVALGARCGAGVLTGRGPYERQLRLTTNEA